jgi:hypothetical protein
MNYTKHVCAVTSAIVCLLFIIVSYHSLFVIRKQLIIPRRNLSSVFVSNYSDRNWISPSLYNELRSYTKWRKEIQSNIKSIVKVANGTYTHGPLSNDYITFTKTDRWKDYPYSSWKCSSISDKDPEATEYCFLTNIYYDSSINQYYYYRGPSEIRTNMTRNRFISSHSGIYVNIIDSIANFTQKGVSAILTRPIHITGPPDRNYAHGFLERCGPQFWVLAEFQSHPSFIDPAKVQLYYSSNMKTDFGTNLWQESIRQPDGTHRHIAKWLDVLQSMFSIYPLLTFESFNQTTVMFKYLIFTGAHHYSRTAAWGFNYYLARKFDYHPFHTRQYRRAYLAYSEWILNNFNLTSKFQLTPIQEQLQQTQQSEITPICNEICNASLSRVETEFTGEWIVVLNRAGVGRRELINADELLNALLKTFPDHSNPYLRVWPKQFNFDDDLYKTARMARSIRLLIGVHGAGLSNTLFMRPGAILYEITPPGCRVLSFNFRRWAEVFNLQHSLWTPGNNQDQCQFDGSTKVNVKEIVNEVINLLQNEYIYRNGYLKRALDIMNDKTLVDHPPSGLENIF